MVSICRTSSYACTRVLHSLAGAWTDVLLKKKRNNQLHPHSSFSINVSSSQISHQRSIIEVEAERWDWSSVVPFHFLHMLAYDRVYSWIIEAKHSVEAGVIVYIHVIQYYYVELSSFNLLCIFLCLHSVDTLDVWHLLAVALIDVLLKKKLTISFTHRFILNDSSSKWKHHRSIIEANQSGETGILYYFFTSSHACIW
jgi:hypothetical protein